MAPDTFWFLAQLYKVTVKLKKASAITPFFGNCIHCLMSYFRIDQKNNNQSPQSHSLDLALSFDRRGEKKRLHSFFFTVAATITITLVITNTTVHSPLTRSTEVSASE